MATERAGGMARYAGAAAAVRLAAPTFAAAATGMDIARPITIEGQPFSLCSLAVGRGSRLDGLSVGAVERDYDVSVVLLRRNGASDYHPAAENILAQDDVVAVLGGPERLTQLTAANL